MNEISFIDDVEACKNSRWWECLQDTNSMCAYVSKKSWIKFQIHQPNLRHSQHIIMAIRMHIWIWKKKSIKTKTKNSKSTFQIAIAWSTFLHIFFGFVHLLLLFFFHSLFGLSAFSGLHNFFFEFGPSNLNVELSLPNLLPPFMPSRELLENDIRTSRNVRLAFIDNFMLSNWQLNELFSDIFSYEHWTWKLENYFLIIQILLSSNFQHIFFDLFFLLFTYEFADECWKKNWKQENNAASSYVRCRKLMK